MTKIGFIGLGRMGLPMASNLCKAGFDVTGFDINSDAIATLVSAGGSAAADIPAATAGMDIVVTMLPDAVAVRKVVMGDGGVLENIKGGAVILDMSTVDPDTTDTLGQEAIAKGSSLVDAPVGRLASHADAGESLFMVGGTKQDFDTVDPLLNAMGSTIYHCGDVGAGTRTKLVNNFLAVASCQFNAEALSFAARMGLDLEKTLDVLYGTTAVNGQLKIAWPAKVLAGDTSPGFTIDLAHKDLSLIMATAHGIELPMPMAAAAYEAFSSARARGFGGQDFSGMLDAQCDLVKLDKIRSKTANG